MLGKDYEDSFIYLANIYFPQKESFVQQENQQTSSALQGEGVLEWLHEEEVFESAFHDE